VSLAPEPSFASCTAFGPDFLCAAIEMIGTEIRELRAVLKHVVDRREQRAGYRAGCLLRAAATSIER
jgi:hypothetical protein